MAVIEAWARSLIASSPVIQERAARAGLKDAAREQEHSNGLEYAVLEEASRASDALMDCPTLASTIVSPVRT